MAGYIKFSGVDGESKDKEHATWSDLAHFTQGFHIPVSSSTHRATSRLSVNDFMVTKLVDSATTLLMARMVQNTHFVTVEIHVTRSYTGQGRETYLKVKLSNVLISSFVMGGATQSDEVPIDELGLNFEKIEVEYLPAGAGGDKEGQLKVEYSLEKN